MRKANLKMVDAPFSITDLEHLCDTNRAQVLIFSQHSRLTFVYPERAPGWQRIHLLETSYLDEPELGHLDTLKEAPKAVTGLPKLNHCCLKETKSRRHHFCSAFRYCQFCRRKILEPTDYHNYLTIDDKYCTKLKFQDPISICDNCHQTSRSDNCMKWHRRRVCSNFIECPTCGQKIYGSR